MNGYVVAILLMLACASIGYGLGKEAGLYENRTHEVQE